MTRISLFLALVLMASALSLVTARFQYRQLYTQSDRLDGVVRQLDMEWRRLQLERAELTRHARIDDIAKNVLGLVAETPERTLYLRPYSTGSDDVTPQAQKGAQP